MMINPISFRPHLKHRRGPQNEGGILGGLLLLAGLAALVFLVSLTVRAYYLLDRKAERFKAASEDVQKARDAESELESKVVEILREREKILRENKGLKDQAEEFESEKAVILDQVRNSVTGFAEYREETAQKIDTLKIEMQKLEDQKQAMQSEIEDVSGRAAMDKAVFGEKIQVLTSAIEEHQTSIQRMNEQLENREKHVIVSEAAKLHYNLGNFYFRNQKHDYAVAEYRKALLYLPDDPDTHFNLAVTLDEHMNDRKGAILHYKKYLALNPEEERHREIEDRILDLELRDKVLEGSQLEKRSSEPVVKQLLNL